MTGTAFRSVQETFRSEHRERAVILIWWLCEPCFKPRTE